MTARGGAVEQLVGRGSVYTLASAAPMLTGVLVTPFLTRSMSVAEYGVVAAAMVVMQFTVGLLAMGLPIAITRTALVDQNGMPGARGVAVLGSLCAIGIAAVAAPVGVGVSFSGWLSGPVVGVALAIGGIGASIAMAQALAVAREAAWMYVLLAFGTSLIAPGVGLAAVRLWHTGSLTYMSALLATYACVAVVAYGQVAASRQVVLSASKLRRSLRVGIPLVPHQLAMNSIAGAAVLIGGAILGVHGSAGAQIALYVGAVPVVLTSAISNAWIPIVLRLPEAERGASLSETARVVTWLAALGSAALAAVAPWVLWLLVPASYDLAAMVPLAAIASLAAVFAAAFQAYSLLVVASGSTGGFAVATPAALVLGSLVSVALAQTVGLAGLGVGYVSAYILLVVFTRLLARRVSPVRLRERGLIGPVAVGVLGAGIAAALPWQGLLAILTRALMAAGFLAVAVVQLIRAIRAERAAEIAVAERTGSAVDVELPDEAGTSERPGESYRAE